MSRLAYTVAALGLLICAIAVASGGWLGYISAGIDLACVAIALVCARAWGSRS